MRPGRGRTIKPGRAVYRPCVFCRLALLPLLFADLGCSEEPQPQPHPRADAIVLITVDTLRADRLGAYGSSLGLTPNLDLLAQNSDRFNFAYAPAPFTLPSVASMMTGRYPEELGILKNSGKVPASVPTIAGRLHQQRWATGAVVSNFVLHPWSGLKSGFRNFDASFDEEEAKRGIRERTASSTTDAAIKMLEWLVVARPNFFFWVHYQDPHGPYTPPGDRRARYLEHEHAASGGRRSLELDPRGLGGLPDYQFLEPHRDVGFYRAGYDGEVSYMDEQLGRLLGWLQARGVLKRTAVIFAADHGESFGEDDYWFAHGEHLNEATLRVPLLIHVPGRAPRVREDLAALTDLSATLLGLAGVAHDPESPGRDLLAPGAEAGASPGYFRTDPPTSEVARTGISDGKFKYLRAGGEEFLYRLPDESSNLAESEPGVLAELRASLEAVRARMGPAIEPQSPGLLKARKEQLEALGYGVDE